MFLLCSAVFVIAAICLDMYVARHHYQIPLLVTYPDDWKQAKDFSSLTLLLSFLSFGVLVVLAIWCNDYTFSWISVTILIIDAAFMASIIMTMEHAIMKSIRLGRRLRSGLK